MTTSNPPHPLSALPRADASMTAAGTADLPDGIPATARAVFRVLRQLQHGTLDVVLPGADRLHFGHPVDGGIRATMRLADWSVCGAVLRSGDIGFAETYIAGGWSTPDLPALMALLLANRDRIDAVVYGTWWGSLLHRVRHALRRNSRAGSRKNIHAHYDLGNAFYQLWLDAGMHYSSAWFEGDLTRPLVEAQAAKARRTLTACHVQPGDRVLEIGCGWGAVAELAGREFGAHVTGLTLSTEQLAYATTRLRSAGIDADLRLQDYRDAAGRPAAGYDAVVSIEMFEAVGRAYWPAYFRALHAALKPGGRACLQTIVIRDDLYARYLTSSDFIQQYIFPGGQLPSRSAFRAAAEQAGFDIVDTLDFGGDYAETLRRWRASFHAADAHVRRLGFDAAFMRIWDFYLAYCEAAFDSGNTGVVQFTLARR